MFGRQESSGQYDCILTPQVVPVDPQRHGINSSRHWGLCPSSEDQKYGCFETIVVRFPGAPRFRQSTVVWPSSFHAENAERNLKELK